MLTGKRKCLAKKVKLADLEHNSGITRLNQEPTEKNHKRLYKYMLARTLLTVAWRIESGMNCEFISVMRPA